VASELFNAEGTGQDAAERYAIGGFPTTVFLNGAGEEVDRIVGYLPPEEFLAELQRIRSGDTFAACIREFDLESFPRLPEPEEAEGAGGVEDSAAA